MAIVNEPRAPCGPAKYPCTTRLTTLGYFFRILLESGVLEENCSKELGYDCPLTFGWRVCASTFIVLIVRSSPRPSITAGIFQLYYAIVTKI